MSSKLLGQVARLTLKTSKLRAEIERLQGLFDKWHTIAAEKHAEIERHIREKVELAGLVAKERARIERLQALLKRHDDLCRKDEAVGNDYVWTPELQELVEDTRAALAGGNLNGFTALLNKMLLQTSDAEILAAVPPEDLADAKCIKDDALRAALARKEG